MIVSLIAAMVAAMQAAPAFKWHISKFAAISNDLLVVEVPADAPIDMYGATADLDLTPYEGRSLGAAIEAEAGPISKAAKGIHGLKFMFHFSGARGGLEYWPEAVRPRRPSRGGVLRCQTPSPAATARRAGHSSAASRA